MSLEKIKELWDEDGYWAIEDLLVEEGEWISDCKYQHQTSIIEFEGKFYEISRSRSGSYHTDYYYNDASIVEVEPKEVVVTTKTWHHVKDGVKGRLPES